MSFTLSEKFEELKPKGVPVVPVFAFEDVERFPALAVVKEEVHRLSCWSCHYAVVCYLFVVVVCRCAEVL